MEVFQSATDVHRRSCDHFSSEPLLQFMVNCQYEKVIQTGSIAENWLPKIGQPFSSYPISLRFVLGGVDKFVFLCIPWFAAIDMFFEHTLGPAVMWG